MASLAAHLSDKLEGHKAVWEPWHLREDPHYGQYISLQPFSQHSLFLRMTSPELYISLYCFFFFPLLFFFPACVWTFSLGSLERVFPIPSKMACHLSRCLFGLNTTVRSCNWVAQSLVTLFSHLLCQHFSFLCHCIDAFIKSLQLFFFLHTGLLLALCYVHCLLPFFLLNSKR